MTKFALVIDGNIVFGPREYYFNVFKRYFEDNSLDYSTLPNNIGESLVITEAYTLLPVVETIYPQLGRFEQLAGPALTITKTGIIEEFTSAPKYIESCKNELKTIVADSRYKKETAPIALNVLGTDVVIEADRQNKMMIINIFGLMGLEDTYNFKFPLSNNWVAVTKAGMGTIVAAFVSQTQDAFDWEKTTIAAIDEAVDFATLDLIDIGLPAPHIPEFV